MATAVITKQSVTKLNNKDYQVTIHVVISEGAEVLLEKDYSERYFSDLSIGAIKTKLQALIATDWDEYEAEQNYFTKKNSL